MPSRLTAVDAEEWQIIPNVLIARAGKGFGAAEGLKVNWLAGHFWVGRNQRSIVCEKGWSNATYHATFLAEFVRTCLRATEVDARPNAHGFYTPAAMPLWTVRMMLPQMFVRMCEIIQTLGAGGLVAVPSYAERSGPLRVDVESATTPAIRCASPGRCVTSVTRMPTLTGSSHS